MQRKAWFAPVERLCGIKVIAAIGPDPTELKAMVDTGTVEWDVLQSGRGAMLELLKQSDYLEAIDYGMVEDSVTANFRSEHGLDIVPYARMTANRPEVIEVYEEVLAAPPAAPRLMPRRPSRPMRRWIAYTTLGAWSSREEHLKGHLKPGMAVLDGAPFAVDPAEIGTVTVEMTLVGGAVKLQHG